MEHSRLVLTVKEFCTQMGIGKTLYYKAQKMGEGPALIRVGGRVLIAQDTALAWLRSRETQVKPTKSKATKLPPAGGAHDIAPVPVLATHDAPAPRPSSIESPASAISRPADWFARGNMGGIPRRRAF